MMVLLAVQQDPSSKITVSRFGLFEVENGDSWKMKYSFRETVKSRNSVCVYIAKS